jgi:hypothetical protein
MSRTVSSRRRATSAVSALLIAAFARQLDASHLWHEMNFRYLPQSSFDLVTWVSNLPRYETFVPMDATRQERFRAFMDALLTAVERTLVNNISADWCGVRARAAAAGYEVRRLFETGKKRWMVYAYDVAGSGQPYVFIAPNPNPQRNLVVESPHNTYDRLSGRLAAQMFLDANGRAFILNKAHRCVGPVSTCSGTGRCSGVHKIADGAHAGTANAFQIVHATLHDRWAGSRFAQVHGFGNATTQPDFAEISDGTSNDLYGGSLAFTNVSTVYVERLKRYIPASAQSGIWACEAIVGSPPNNMCGNDNTQGRYTNGNDATHTTTSAEACTTPQYNYTGRFLHLEAGREFRDDSETDGMSWP